ncbi:MAG: aspartate--tRNA ligase [Simkaniaceae bacterium]|nr:aspartate--tRNA ligase [Simkaniaceae bacterium]
MLTNKRTHHCNELSHINVEEKVHLIGWVHRRRDHGGLIFIDLRDRNGLTQLLFDPEKAKNAHNLAGNLRSEWVIQVEGKVVPRAEGMINPNLQTGKIEIEVFDLEIISQAKTPPFSICDQEINISEDLRLKYRYLDIRRGEIAANLRLRHQAMMVIRKYLDSLSFHEISTPILGRSTPEGARDYLVPSRVYPGNFYALPQSPQIFKQLLMISGMERYFQIAPCFRDEDLRSDRQPEFTQIDIEMSFGDTEDIIDITEALMIALFKECLGINIGNQFPRLTHAKCMESYGSDRPDLRFAMPLIRIDHIALKSEFSVFLNELKTGGCVKCLCVKGGADISRKEIDAYTAFVSEFGLKGLGWMKMQEDKLHSSITKFFSEDLLTQLASHTNAENGDLLLFAASSESLVNKSLDHLRRRLAKNRNLIDPNVYKFLWVTDFPLFEMDAENGRIKSVHHPFTHPHPEDIHLLEKDPLKVRSDAYDIVLNGYELGGGSKRIHNPEMQQEIFKVLKISPEDVKNKFDFFVEALKYGTPPHLGIAMGLDRVIMLLAKTDNIRDVIAFPKTQKASDLMMQSPSSVSDEQLNELKLQTESKEIYWL